MNKTFSCAVFIVNELVRAGHIAYFAGGWVRDYVMGHPSEDIDIATSAAPAEIMDLFPGTILVGLAFGVVIVPMEGHQFEVATFRKDLNYIDGRHPTNIELSSNPQEDAYRRDFTINGMFYDPIEKRIHDYVDGQEDIKRGVIRTIGDPYERFFEDRLRLLRAFRFSSRFSFNIDADTQEAIRENADKLFPAVAMERVWQEFNKMSAYPRFDRALIEMHRLSLLAIIFPELTGVHLHDLIRLVGSYPYFPSQCPTILYVMELFPDFSLKQKIDIGKRLKVPNRDVKLVELMDELSKLALLKETNRQVDRSQWAHLFALPDCFLCLQVLAARLPPSQQSEFLQDYQRFFESLYPHVERIRLGKPLISSDELRQFNIQPGKRMGLLLKEAEKMAINDNLNDKDYILNQLRKMSLWETSL